MPREVELRPGCEDAHPTRVRRIILRQDEGRFAEIEFASNLLHALGRNAGRVRQNRELITAERCRTENVDDVKCVLHEINLRVLPQALTTRLLRGQPTIPDAARSPHHGSPMQGPSLGSLWR